MQRTRQKDIFRRLAFHLFHAKGRRGKRGAIVKKVWRDKLQNVYQSLPEFENYSDVYGLAKRLGFESASIVWELNPIIEGSTDPKDYKLATPHGNETVKGQPIRCYDSGENSGADR